jgi:hypothetical protein
MPEEVTDECPRSGAIMITKGEEELVIMGLTALGLLG